MATRRAEAYQAYCDKCGWWGPIEPEQDDALNAAKRASWQIGEYAGEDTPALCPECTEGRRTRLL
jgi:hypothetical protein